MDDPHSNNSDGDRQLLRVITSLKAMEQLLLLKRNIVLHQCCQLVKLLRPWQTDHLDLKKPEESPEKEILNSTDDQNLQEQDLNMAKIDALLNKVQKVRREVSSETIGKKKALKSLPPKSQQLPQSKVSVKEKSKPPLRLHVSKKKTKSDVYKTSYQQAFGMSYRKVQLAQVAATPSSAENSSIPILEEKTECKGLHVKHSQSTLSFVLKEEEESVSLNQLLNDNTTAPVAHAQRAELRLLSKFQQELKKHHILKERIASVKFYHTLPKKMHEYFAEWSYIDIDVISKKN